ncbi:MAG: malonyl-CoA decarboxylase family protein [Deltaproteobacteria bacterium]|nr:malonyl-CoA decarboxylase family protein [Deltaproteobacteria bacterium]
MSEEKETAEVKVDESRIEALVSLFKDTASASDIERTDLEGIRDRYLELKREEKPEFFKQLLETVEVRPEDVAGHIEKAAQIAGDPDDWRQALTGLRSAIESPRLRLFLHFIGLPGGLKFLLNLRADILTAQRQGVTGLEALDYDLTLPFESWFHGGFLSLTEITLDSPYRQIEIFKNGDMVHPMTSIEEMGQRLGQDRRCFALYHQAMPEEPVVFIEVALTKGIVQSIHDIIGPEAQDQTDSSRRDTAVFYSINNTQNGLAGLGLGQVLIFQVVDFLKDEAPEIKQFCTLSPLPGFWRRFLKPLLEGNDENLTTKTESLGKLFDKKTVELLVSEYQGQGGTGDLNLPEMLQAVFVNAHWTENKTLVEALSKPMTRLGFMYLNNETDQLGRPLDPVANFHIGNGATVSAQNVNYGANYSPLGLEQSLSLMVNYVYSQSWLKQIRGSMARLGGFFPQLSRSRR